MLNFYKMKYFHKNNHWQISIQKNWKYYEIVEIVEYYNYGACKNIFEYTY